MPQKRLFEDINARISEIFASSPTKDVEKNLRAMFHSALAKLELVTREEFDAQAKVLERTREKLAALQARVAELEERLRHGP